MMNHNTETMAINQSNRINRQSARTFCLICQKSVRLLTFGQTAELFKTDVRDIYPLTQKTSLHLLHNRRGEVMVCEEVVLDVLHERQMRISNPQILTLKPLI